MEIKSIQIFASKKVQIQILKISTIQERIRKFGKYVEDLQQINPTTNFQGGQVRYREQLYVKSIENGWMFIIHFILLCDKSDVVQIHSKDTPNVGS